MTNGGVIGRDNRPSVYSAAGVWGVNEAYHARLSNNWPGEVLVHVGSFTDQAATGPQAVTGVGFTPKALLFFAANGNTGPGSGAWSPHVFQALGFTAGTAQSYAVASGSDDNVATSDTSRNMSARAIVKQHNQTALTCEADLQSFDADGFTLNWVNTDYLASDAIMYIALGGNIQAEVLNWQTRTSTGNHSVTTGTFQPDLVFNITSWLSTFTSSTTSHVTLGAMNSAGEQWFLHHTSTDNVAGGLTTRVQRTDSCLGYASTDEAILERASFVSMDANGFTVNFNAVDGGGAYQAASLCIKGVQSKLGAFNKSTGAAPVTQSITAPGFTPVGVLTTNYGTTTSTTPFAGAIMTMGATDGVNERLVGLVDRDGANPTTEADSIWYNNKAIGMVNISNVTDAVGDIAFTATGFDVTWTTNDAVAREALYAAIGTP